MLVTRVLQNPREPPILKWLRTIPGAPMFSGTEIPRKPEVSGHRKSYYLLHRPPGRPGHLRVTRTFQSPWGLSWKVGKLSLGTPKWLGTPIS